MFVHDKCLGKHTIGGVAGVYNYDKYYDTLNDGTHCK